MRAMRWSHNDQWMITGDHAGFVKYWQSNMNNVKMYQGHKEPIRSLRWDIVPTHGRLQLVSKIIQCLNWIFKDNSKDAEACYNVAERVCECLQGVVKCETQKYLYLTKYALLFLLWKLDNALWTWVGVCNVLCCEAIDVQKYFYLFLQATCEAQKYLYLTKYALLFLFWKLSSIRWTWVGVGNSFCHAGVDVQKYLYLTKYAFLFLLEAG